MLGGGKPDWGRLGPGWPNREASRFVLASGMRWHVQVMGAGPTLLLLHGTGAATHSWRDLLPLLARDFTVVAPDLPGHGFTDTPGGDGLSLDGMARGVARLTQALGVEPRLVVGHSAGAAVALRMSLDGRAGADGIVSLNGALQPFPGSNGHIFPVLAKVLFLNPVAVRAFAWRAAQPGAVARLIEGTGSRLDARGLELYRALFSTTGHVAGALGMMSRWNLQPLQAQLGTVQAPLTLVAADADKAVPPRDAVAAQARVAGSTLLRLPGLGHLAHEEDPHGAADLIRRALAGGRAEAAA